MSAGRRDSRSVTDLSSNASMFVRKWRLVLADLPDPSERWESTDYDIPQKILKELRDYGIIKAIDKNGEKRIFKTTAEGYKGIQDWMEVEKEQDGFLPCGHDGLNNIGNGKVKCTRKGCEKVHTKAAINEHNA